MPLCRMKGQTFVMKKVTVSLAVMLLMTIVFLPTAFADEFCSIGTVIAGSEINVPISVIAPDAKITRISLPIGCIYTEEPLDGGKRIYLRGCPMWAGEQGFSITVSSAEEEYNIVGTMNILPDVARVSANESLSCAPGAELSLEVSAEISDMGELSYQWFKDAEFFPQEIEGATEASYVPSTQEPGSRSYFCRVTNTNNGFISFVDSDIITVSVRELHVAQLQIESAPAVIKYSVGDRPNLSGLSLRVYYDDGSSSVVDNGYSYYPEVFSYAGTQYIHFEYKGSECILNIMVENPEEVIKGIGVLTLPHKTEYEVSDMPETAGLSIRVYTNTGSYDVFSGLDCSPTAMSAEGRQTITVSYGGKECTFAVSVKAKPLNAEPTPQPPAPEATDTPADTKPSLSQASRNSANILVKIIFITAVAALAGLWVYIIYMSKKGRR